MTARRLYEMHADVLWETKRQRWNGQFQRFDRRFPKETPPAWPFLDGDNKDYFRALAKRLSK